MAQTEREIALTTIRAKAIADTDALSHKQRFALFSSPVPLAIGDTQYQTTKINKNENGQVVTQPKNMSIRAPQEGKSKSSYFSMLGFTTIGDPYIEAEKYKLQQELESKKHANKDAVFKPASSVKTMIKGAYQHEADYKPVVKNYKDADGKVITEPKNITASLHAKGLFVPYPHEVEPYDRARQFATKERISHQAMLKDKAQFRTFSHGDKTFSNNKEAFGYDPNQQQVRFDITDGKAKKEFQPNIYKHDNPFRPSNPPKTGLQGYLGKFPDYKGDPIRQVVRIDQVKGKESFKINSPSLLIRPTPSISMFPANIRKDMASSSVLFN